MLTNCKVLGHDSVCGLFVWFELGERGKMNRVKKEGGTPKKRKTWEYFTI